MACSTPFQSPQYTVPLATIGWAEMVDEPAMAHFCLSVATLAGVIDESVVNPVRALLPW